MDQKWNKNTYTAYGKFVDSTLPIALWYKASTRECITAGDIKKIYNIAEVDRCDLTCVTKKLQGCAPMSGRDCEAPPLRTRLPATNEGREPLRRLLERESPLSDLVLSDVSTTHAIANATERMCMAQRQILQAVPTQRRAPSRPCEAPPPCWTRADCFAAERMHRTRRGHPRERQ